MVETRLKLLVLRRLDDLVIRRLKLARRRGLLVRHIDLAGSSRTVLFRIHFLKMPISKVVMCQNPSYQNPVFCHIRRMSVVESPPTAVDFLEAP